jgi:hypothetical protein
VRNEKPVPGGGLRVSVGSGENKRPNDDNPNGTKRPKDGGSGNVNSLRGHRKRTSGGGPFLEYRRTPAPMKFATVISKR